MHFSLPFSNFLIFFAGTYSDSPMRARTRHHWVCFAYDSYNHTKWIKYFNLFWSSNLLALSCTCIYAFPVASGCFWYLARPLSLCGAVFVLSQAPVLHRGVSARRKQVHFLIFLYFSVFSENSDEFSALETVQIFFSTRPTRTGSKPSHPHSTWWWEPAGVIWGVDVQRAQTR